MAYKNQELPNLDPDNQDVAIESLAVLEEEAATPTKLRFKTYSFLSWQRCHHLTNTLDVNRQID